MDLINKGDTVFLGHNGQIAKFQVQRVDSTHVWLAYNVENVTHIKRVLKAQVLKLISRAS